MKKIIFLFFLIISLITSEKEFNSVFEISQNTAIATSVNEVVSHINAEKATFFSKEISTVNHKILVVEGNEAEEEEKITLIKSFFHSEFTFFNFKEFSLKILGTQLKTKNNPYLVFSNRIPSKRYIEFQNIRL